MKIALSISLVSQMLLVVLISNLFNVSTSQFEGSKWYMEEPEAYTKLIRLGLYDMNMFHSSIMVHNQSIHSFDMKSLPRFVHGLILEGIRSNYNFIEARFV